ncbi:MFS transporter [Amycolatopsis sp. cmx-8-4]|uniref:MFS transporter n=1 Tax=Amycolatopsis sp. cmx-8-4 TaxID=2790947 RepID=UPI00397C0476
MEIESASPEQARLEAEVGDRLDRLPVGSWHRRLVALVGIGTVFTFFEAALGAVLVPLLPAGWVVTTADKSIVIGSVFVGEILGALFLVPLADRFGRRTMFQVNLAGYAVLAVISAFASDLPTFVVLRVLMGIGLGAELILVDSFLAELLPAARRGRMIGQCYVFGYLAPAAVGLLAAFLPRKLAGIDSWRWLLVFSALGAVVVLLLRRHLPESPRWLAARGQNRAALTAMSRIETAAARLSGPSPTVRHQAPSRVGDDTSAHGAIADDESGRAVPLRMWHPPLLNRTLLASIIWTCQTVGYYGFASIAPLVLLEKGFTVTKSLGYTGFTALGYPLGALLMMVSAERIQRKYLLVAASLVVACLGIVFGVADATWLIVVAGFGLTVANVVMGNVSHAYTSELFPTSLRATANGRTYSLSRGMSAVLPFIALPILYNLGSGILYVLCALILVVVAAAVLIWGPHTNARQLESI